MKVEYMGTSGFWWWKISDERGGLFISGDYTRRRDAVRGFERFCAAIGKMKA